MSITKRIFISFDEYCPYKCKFCYTYGIKRSKIRTDEEIINDLQGEEFDIIYVSQKNDNFAIPEKGIDLCKKALEKYKSHLFIITRNVFTDCQIDKLLELKKQVESFGKKLFIAISINSISSASICEEIDLVPTPNERLKFIKRLYEKGFLPILMLRPIFPNSLIPIKECLDIIQEVYKYVSCVVTGELGVNEDVLNRLKLNCNDIVYKENQEYLQGAIECDIKFLNVENELLQIRKLCETLKLECFNHSMPALNYILKKYYS